MWISSRQINTESGPTVIITELQYIHDYFATKNHLLAVFFHIYPELLALHGALKF